MKKIAALILLVLALGIIPTLGHADCATTDLGSACADNGVILLDGNDSNPDPLDGTILIDTNESKGCADDDNTPEDGMCIDL